MQQLDANQMALTGRTLIEASAGTGKTYTIASLYLRYIVEQPLGCDLTTDQLLVVTFTRAATAELRERIRQRLHLAVACFRGQNPDGDQVIAYLLEHYRDQKERVLKRLYAAEKSMDEAAIYTIHGFCHRAIMANGFATAAGHAELLESEEELLIQVVEDFWRQLLYPLTGSDYTDVVQALKKPKSPLSPHSLARQLKGILSLKSVELKPKPLPLPIHQLLDSLKAKRAKAWSDFQHVWQGKSDALRPELESIPRAQKRAIQTHLSAISAWLEHESYRSAPQKALDYIEDKVQHKAEVAKEGLTLCADFIASCQRLAEEVDYRPQLMSQILSWVQQKLIEEKRKQQVLAPDDLMRVLFESLNNGQAGVELAQQLAGQYPVALIDEFQDTDPLQYGIFSRIYSQAQDYAWLMIGDPKQSIYAFRGGDIHTYGMAKEGTDESRWLSLDKNYRSSQSMVEAVNALFGYRQQSEFLSETIRYEKVTSHDQGEKGGLILNQQPQPAITLWQFADGPSSGETAAAQCAEQIVALLNGEATLGNKSLQPGDLAILVRNRMEAQEISTQLRNRQVRSVFLSRDSVFATEIARQLLQWAEAVYQSGSERLLMATLANGLVPYSSFELAQLRQNEASWQLHLERFKRYQELWFKRGILTAIHHWLADYQIPSHLMADTIHGERCLADLLHAVELLQSASMKLEGPYSLLRHFRSLVQHPDEESRSQQLRLESDKELVQIVTIHASKGLEYPVVFIPFGLAAREAKNAIYPESGSQVVEFADSVTGLERADRERLAEEIRLFYVAITRAVYCCYIGLARREKSVKGQSALGHLLDLQEASAEAIAKGAEQLVARASGLIRSQLVEPGVTLATRQHDQQQGQFVAKTFRGQLDLSWRLTSYSALSSHTQQAQAPEYVPGVSDEFETSELVAEPTLPNRFSFQKGAQAGNALHQILEWQQFAQSTHEQLANWVGQGLRQSAIADAEEWQPVVTAWLEEILQTPLPVAGTCLGALQPEQSLAEMEFFIHVGSRIDAQAFNQLLAHYPVLETPVAPLLFERFHGLVKGFIDLIFQVDGRFFVCDYKSNHLGSEFEDYNQEAMSQAMAEHRYDAQLILYTLALHRYLKQKLGRDYCYETHIGGAAYLFLRGMTPENSGQTGVFEVKPQRELIEALDTLFGAEQ